MSYDEIILALWGHPSISNTQVSQLIMQMRRAVGDDSRRQLVIRTLSGFGYRWASPVEAGHPAEPPGRPRDHSTTGHAVAVLPLDVGPVGDDDCAWIRLGAMDLIAGRLRQSGLTVPSSDDVVSAVHVNSGQPESERPAALRKTLDAGVLVHGSVSRNDGTWRVELASGDSAGDRRRVRHEGADVLETARRATDLLLSALGRQAPDKGGKPSDRLECLHRIRAALLADEFDTARRIYETAPADLRDDPRLQCEHAHIVYRSGRLDEAGELVEALLETGRVTESPRLRARLLTLRGLIAARAVDLADWHTAEKHCDDAVNALSGRDCSPELGAALALRGLARGFLERFGEAVRDLGWSRSQLEITGDRLGMSSVNSYFGLVELKRNRPLSALSHFSAGAEISRAFGAADKLRGSLSGMLEARIRLLDWAGALQDSEQILALLDRIKDPAFRTHAEIGHANLLIHFGRLREAGSLLARIGPVAREFPPPFISFGHRAQATLDWLQGRFGAAMNSASEVLALWPADISMDADQRARAALLHQRASIAAGKPRPAWNPYAGSEAATPNDDVVAVYLVANAEWAAFQDRYADARRLFDAALGAAETHGVPDTLVLVADACVRWLLARGETSEASALAGRVAQWAAQDYDCALLQTAVYHADGQTEAWARALRRSRKLAGERRIPEAWLTPP